MDRAVVLTRTAQPKASFFGSPRSLVAAIAPRCGIEGDAGLTEARLGFMLGYPQDVTDMAHDPPCLRTCGHGLPHCCLSSPTIQAVGYSPKCASS